MSKKQSIEKEIDLRGIPKYLSGRYKGKINWQNSEACKITGIYDGVKFEFIVKSYDKNNQILKINYNDEDFNIPTKRITNCNLGKVLGIITSEFKIETGVRFQNDKRDITIIDRKKIQDKKGRWIKYYRYKCNKCGFDCGEHYSTKDEEFKDEFWIDEYNLMKGNGCSCCSISPIIVVENINSIYKTNPWMIQYIGEECAKTHTNSSREEAKITCPDCGREKKISISNLNKRQSIGCICNDTHRYSYGHKYTFSLLYQLKQNFIDNHTLNWCKFYNPYKQKETTGEYDFVLENIKTIIEVDGGFHRKDNNMSGQTKEESVFLDNEKDRLAEEHGYKVIRIIYNDDKLNIKKNILDSDLNKLFDLEKIDWLKCNKFALSNRVKEACKYKKNNPNITTTEIGNIMNIDRQTIIKYLKKGNELGWCYYNVKEEMRKIGEKAGLISINGSKQVEIFKNGISLGIYPSVPYIVKESINLFGIKLSGSNIYNVCLGKRKLHGGFTFKYA